VGTGKPAANRGPRARQGRRWQRAAKVGRFVLGLGLAGLALYVVLTQTGDLAGSERYLAGLRWQWVLAAAVAQSLSLAAFAGLQGRLLRSGGVRVGLGALSAITLAGNGLSNSLPAGPAFATAFSFRQFRRRGADITLASWTIVASTVLAAVALTALASIGLVVGNTGGNAPGATVEVLASLGLMVVLLAAFRQVGRAGQAAVPVLSVCRRLTGHPRGEPEKLVTQVVARLNAIELSLPALASAMGWAFGNWLGDCATLALAFLAVGVPVPWRGLLVAYGTGQLAANLPITPGGLGVVEGSITIALVAYGGAAASTVAAVLVYRLLSFWVLLPVGWGAVGALVLGGRRQDRHLAPETGGAG
jgi:uncharacterized protein (TIRG00374 family)